MSEQSSSVLAVSNLKKYFDQNTGILSSILSNKDRVRAVDDVSFSLESNEVTGVIGESGCGKSTLIRTIMGLTEPTAGSIQYNGSDTSSFGRRDWKEFRRNIQMIFQDPFNSLDPKLSIRETLKEPLQIHNMDNKDERITNMLEKVELNPSKRYLDRWPRQLSGGEKQRVSIARALVLDPQVILADEPVSMLDVSTQASVLNLLSELIDDLGVSMLYISHDLSTVSYVCDEVNVMYLGRFVETASTSEIIQQPKHPYTQALINAVPVPDPHYDREGSSLPEIDEQEPATFEGCRFKDRCPERMDICDTKPHMIEDTDNHHVACHLHYDHEARANELQGDELSASPTEVGGTIPVEEGGNQ